MLDAAGGTVGQWRGLLLPSRERIEGVHQGVALTREGETVELLLLVDLEDHVASLGDALVRTQVLDRCARPVDPRHRTYLQHHIALQAIVGDAHHTRCRARRTRTPPRRTHTPPAAAALGRLF